MNKREFLSKLNEYMSYELPESMVREKLKFYSDYIDSESTKGRSVSQVIDELGDPQLIARSIIDAAKSGPDGIPGTDDDIDFGDSIASNGRRASQSAYSDYGSGNGRAQGSSTGTVSEDGSPADGNNSSNAHNPWGSNIHVYNMGCFTAVLIVLVIFSLLSLAGSILGALSPALAPVCIVLLIVWLLGKTGGRRW